MHSLRDCDGVLTVSEHRHSILGNEAGGVLNKGVVHLRCFHALLKQERIEVEECEKNSSTLPFFSLHLDNPSPNITAPGRVSPPRMVRAPYNNDR